MSTSAPLPKPQPLAAAVSVSPTSLEVTLLDGRQVSAPLGWFPRLLAATPAQRNNHRLIGAGIGIHWPDPDEGLSFQFLLSPT